MYTKEEHNNNNDDDDDDDDDDEPLLVSLFGLREDDVDRMQQKNDLIRLAFAGEFTRPMDEQTIERVLDIGCGPLSWSIDFAKTHPKAQVIGMDYVNMIPPEIAMDLPSNCQLLIHNCIKDFPYDDATVDLCHVRFMNVSLTMEQYSKMVRHCWRVLKPGGYLELMEMDMLVYSPGPVTELLNQQVIELVRTLGLKPRLARLLKDVLPKDAVGLTDQHITEFYRSLPIGNWGGRLGWLFRDDLLYALTHARNFGAPDATAGLSSSSVVGDNNNKIYGEHGEKNGENDGDDDDSTKSEEDLFENRLVAAEKELEQYKSYSNFHFIRVQKPL
ncbi:S-adenosyl-L-methionine-dependent methyltransferase [Absidia repens]|uniref:S-adenosyl-L-methionine-dependent methyltransferase n=1 Tax=Absidia repens TaxID=90262 RepID=A0A1X2IX40_9FUNG|nr:S-adenosyl-L-methionine-dependent methyltransferase [Absidia repens]